MEYVTLNNGLKMPILGFGVFQIPKEDTEKCVLDAIEVGYRLFDTAQSYGNERAVGNAIKASGLDRSEFFITTKLWISEMGYEKAKKSIEGSLERLQMDYLDLLLIHQPFGDPFHQQVEANEIMKKYGVQIQAWAPFAEGKNDLFGNETLVEIGKKYNKSAAQVTLRYLIQRGISVLPKSVKKERMQQNFEVFDFELNQEDMDAILKLDQPVSSFFDHADPAMVERLTGYTRTFD